MKRIFLGAAGISALLITAPLNIAKAAPPLPQPSPPDPSWTGFYVGLHAGGAWQSNQTDTFADPNGAIGPVSANVGSKLGAVGGFHAGYNWQFSPTWVAGIEGDFSWASVKNNVAVTPLSILGTFIPNTLLSMSAGPNWLSSVRVGWASSAGRTQCSTQRAALPGQICDMVG
jgi:outer membrane immunogenic protein